MCRGVFSGFIIFTLLGYLNSEDLSCGKVKDEFTKISSEDLVPDFPLLDEDLRICARSLSTRQASCCSRDSELQYLRAAEHFLQENVHTKTAHLKTVVTSHSQAYQDGLLALVHHFRNKTSAKLRDWYSVPSQEHRAIEKLFTDIENYFKLGNVMLKNSVETFFDDLFPVIFKHVIYRQPSSTWSHHFHHCLTRKRQDIQPAPFGKYPEEIAENLHNNLALAKAYLSGLSVIEETIEAMNSLSLEDTCKHAVTRLQYCSHCKGFVNVKPCNGFCSSVMRGCFVNMAEIGGDWNDIISSIEGMVPRMTKKSMSEIFKELEVAVSDAIMHAMVAAPDFYQNVHNLCGIPMEAAGITWEPRNLNFSAHNAQTTEVSGPLAMEVMETVLQLINFKTLYWNLAEDVCSQADTFEQDPLSGTCWNGTSISVYVHDVADLDILSQARKNKEVTVSLILDPQMRNLKDKLSVTNLNLQLFSRKNGRQSKAKNEMISDGPYRTMGNYETLDGSSGDNQGTVIGNVNMGVGTTLQDDEDFNGGGYVVSGSGSGDDAPFDDTDTNVDVIISKPPTFDQGGNLGPERPPHPNNPPHNKSQKKGSGAADLRVSLFTVVLSLFLCIFHIRR